MEFLICTSNNGFDDTFDIELSDVTAEQAKDVTAFAQEKLLKIVTPDAQPVDNSVVRANFTTLFREMQRGNNKIQAIKALRSVSTLGLLDCKQLIDQFWVPQVSSFTPPCGDPNCTCAKGVEQVGVPGGFYAGRF